LMITDSIQVRQANTLSNHANYTRNQKKHSFHRLDLCFG
jgi:hypothetical protein